MIYQYNPGEEFMAHIELDRFEELAKERVLAKFDIKLEFERVENLRSEFITDEELEPEYIQAIADEIEATWDSL